MFIILCSLYCAGTPSIVLLKPWSCRSSSVISWKVSPGDLIAREHLTALPASQITLIFFKEKVWLCFPIQLSVLIHVPRTLFSVLNLIHKYIHRESMNPYQELCHLGGRSPSPLQCFRCAFKALSFNRGASQVALVVKNPPVHAGDLRALGSVPGLVRSPGGRHDNPLQYSCLENPMDRGAWWAIV